MLDVKTFKETIDTKRARTYRKYYINGSVVTRKLYEQQLAEYTINKGKDIQRCTTIYTW